MPRELFVQQNFEERSPDKAEWLLGISNGVLLAFGMDLPINRPVYLFDKSLNRFKEDAQFLYFKIVQIIDADQDGIYYVAAGTPPSRGASYIPIDNLDRIIVPGRTSEKNNSEVPIENHKRILFPPAYQDGFTLPQKTMYVFGMELPLDRSVELIMSNGNSLMVRAIFYTSNEHLIARHQDSPITGPCITIHRDHIKGVKFLAENSEVQSVWTSKNINAHSENAKSNKFTTHDSYPHPYNYAPDYSKGVEGIYGNCLKAFGLYIPRDRPVLIKVDSSKGYRDCHAQIVDIDKNGRVYFFPLERQQNEGGYLYWNGLNNGALSMPASYITGFAFTPDIEIEAAKNEVILYPDNRKELYDIGAIPSIEIHGLEVPLYQTVRITTIDGEKYCGSVIFKSYVNTLLLRPEGELFSDGCDTVSCNEIKEIEFIELE